MASNVVDEAIFIDPAIPSRQSSLHQAMLAMAYSNYRSADCIEQSFGSCSSQLLTRFSADVQTKKFKAPKGKKIYVPVRVEPKVYFAGERTFLGWVSIHLPLASNLST